MSLDIPDNLPNEIKDYIKDYNNAFAKKDVMEIDLALNGLVTLVFSNDEILRKHAISTITKIGTIQYKFLKNAIRALLHRYKGDDLAKSEIASIALGEIVVDKPAAQLITEPELLQKITDEYHDRKNKTAFEEQKKQEFLDKVRNVQLDLETLKIIPEIYSIGQYYNKCMVDDKIEEAAATIRSLIVNLFKWEKENPANYSAGIMLFNLIADSKKRPAFFKEIIDYFLGFLNKGTEQEKESAKELLTNIFDSIQDFLAPELIDWARHESIRKQEAREAKLKEDMEKRENLKKMMVTPKLKWDVEIQKMAKTYNEAIKVNDQKTIAQLIKPLMKYLESNDELMWKSAGDFIGMLLARVPDLVKSIVDDLLKSYRKPKNSEILSLMVESLKQLDMAKPQIIEEIIEDQKKREEEREKIKKEKEEEYKKIEEVTVKFEGDWDNKLVKLGENLNKALLKKSMGDSKKLIDNELNALLRAKDTEIRLNAQEYFIRIAEKYPDLLSNIINEMLELFNTENEARFLAVELLGKVYHSEKIDKLVPSATEELKKKIEHDYDERRKEIENQQMAEKIHHIKIDVQTIPILEWPKDIQKICRNYNDAIMKQDLNTVIPEVQKIVEIFMEDKKEERLNASIQVIGLIAKKNIELIAPTIEMLLKMVDSEKPEIKIKAIRALGEICEQRPGWAYMGLEKLAQIVEKDPNETARMKAIFELSKVGKSNATMLVEYVPTIIHALSNDKNQQVRRLAAWTLQTMAEVIPLEAKDAIDALTDALHDSYELVRKFADRALQLIRAAMRKEGS